MGKSGKSGRAKQVHRVKVLHPSSRKAVKLAGACMRKQRIEKKHTQTAIKQTLLIDKLQWFKDNRDTSLDSYNRADMAVLVQRYLGRFEDELDQIGIIHGMKDRKNRQHAAREDVIRMTMQREADAFKTSGIDMPDLSNKKNLELFLKWDGTSKHSALIKTRKIKFSDLTTSSNNNTQDALDKKDADEIDNDDEDNLLEGADDGEDIEDEDSLLEGDGKEEENEDEVVEESNEKERTNSMDVEMEQT